MAMYDLYEVIAQTPQKAKRLNDVVRELLLANDQACYKELEPFLMPPGVRGSCQFDHAMCIQILRNHDKSGMLKKFDVSDFTLWQKHLQQVLFQFGFDLQRGRLLGVKTTERVTSKEEVASEEEAFVE